jgi:pyruvate dehydrogenase kinase 2/3/4
MKPAKAGRNRLLPEATPNPSMEEGQYVSWPNQRGADGGWSKRYHSTRRYFAAVDDTDDWPPELQMYNLKFGECLKKIKRRHDGVVTTMAQGILEYKRKRQRLQIDRNIQSFLDRFYLSRIGIRMLIGQHIALTDQSHFRDPTYVGIICTKTNVQELAQEAIENARFVCEDHYGLFEAPRIQLVCNPNINFMYVPGHLSHMLFETLKNSLRAVVETHGQDKQEFPVTKVIVAEGKEDITIKISDEGGGIPRSAIPLVWTYMYTTVNQTPMLDPDFDKSDFKAPMAGFGYGLPISRLYARYFGGDLKLISMEGYVFPRFSLCMLFALHSLESCLLTDVIDMAPTSIYTSTDCLAHPSLSRRRKTRRLFSILIRHVQTRQQLPRHLGNGAWLEKGLQVIIVWERVEWVCLKLFWPVFFYLLLDMESGGLKTFQGLGERSKSVGRGCHAQDGMTSAVILQVLKYIW